MVVQELQAGQVDGCSVRSTGYDIRSMAALVGVVDAIQPCSEEEGSGMGDQ